MKKDRRSFLNQMSAVAALAAFSKPLSSVASVSRHINSYCASAHAITVYHTNDLHGNFDPIIDNIGGVRQINRLLKNQETSGLLLDGGDFLNGAHSLFVQKEVIYTMNTMGYHAAAIGNHELAQGQEHLAALIPLMRFTLVNCNYELNSELSKLVKPYIIIHSGKFKVGITGVGHQLKGIKYNDAITSANSYAKLLKEQENCDLVICLSHLGYLQKAGLPDNYELAHRSEHIDMIVSGHEQKLLKCPAIVLNKVKHEVVVSQAGWDGIMMGKSVFAFDGARQKYNVDAKHFIAGQPFGQTFNASFEKLRLIEKQLKTA